MSKNLLDSATIHTLLRNAARIAGHEIAYIQLSANMKTQSVMFSVTDSHGAHFSGEIPESWLGLPVTEVYRRLIDLYPLAFTPKEDPEAEKQRRIQEAMARVESAVSELTDASKALVESMK